MTVANQLSSAFTLTVQPPQILAVSLYDMVGLNAAELENNECYAAVGENPNIDVVEVIGVSFGSNRALVSLAFLLGNLTLPCDLCTLGHTLARCPVPLFVGRSKTATIVFSLAGRNATHRYRFDDIMLPPVITAVQPSVMPTTGGSRLLLITGTELKDRGTVVLRSPANVTLPCRTPPLGNFTGTGGVL